MPSQTLLVYGAIASFIIAPLLAAASCGVLLLRWDRLGHWQEAKRHEHRPRMWFARWIWFRWIHPDCQYWIAFVDFNKGPVTLTGYAPSAVYWSFTYNKVTEVNPVLNMRQIDVDHANRYRIHLSVDEPTTNSASNWLRLRQNIGRGVIYFRVYEQANAFPTPLPNVTQARKTLIKASLS